jgi:8-oxo-dGTP diphosphatase
MQSVVTFVADNFFWVFVGILLVNLLQRRYQETAQKKRFATLYLAIAAFFVYTGAQLLVEFELSPYYFVPAVALIIGVVYYYREHTFPFRLRCPRSGRILNLETILFRDSNILPEAENGAPAPPDEDEDAD